MYKGFNTIGATTNFSTTGREVVLQNLYNMLNIRTGEVVGDPTVGTDIWNYLFEPNVPEVERKVEAEIERLIDSDPRIRLESVDFFSQHNGIRLLIDVFIIPDKEPSQIAIFFDERTNIATLS